MTTHVSNLQRSQSQRSATGRVGGGGDLNNPQFVWETNTFDRLHVSSHIQVKNNGRILSDVHIFLKKKRHLLAAKLNFRLHPFQNVQDFKDL